MAAEISGDIATPHKVNKLRPSQNDRHSARDIYKCIFLNENIRILFQFFLKILPNGPINNMVVPVQIMAQSKAGAKPFLNEW